MAVEKATLYIELISPNSESDELMKYSYSLEKIEYLNYDSGEFNKIYAYDQLEEISEFIEGYVSLEEGLSDFEYYVLVQIALYLNCLENNCLLNGNIPNDLRYRRKLLTNDKLKELICENENI
ncbi:hypothetical protein [Clostridium butyricum]